MFESFNLNKFNNNKSFMLDMINNPYPSLTSHLYDYFYET